MVLHPRPRNFREQIMCIFFRCWARVKIYGKIPSFSGGTNFYFGVGRLGWDKGKFKFLYFTKTNILFTLPTTFWYGMIKLLRLRKLSEFKIIEAKKFVFLIAYIQTHQKSS